MNPEISSKTDNIALKLRPVAGIVLHVRSILNWEKPYHAPILASFITMIFMLLWLIDTSVLSKLCIIAILLIILDFVLPIGNTLVAPKEWLDEHEASFQNFCLRSAIVWYQVSSFYETYFQMKRTNTKTFYVSLLTFFLFTAWIGSIVHNLLLTYLITLGLILYPGLSKQEAFKQYFTEIIMRISSLAPKSQKSKKN